MLNRSPFSIQGFNVDDDRNDKQKMGRAYATPHGAKRGFIED
jgi:hypothetical protein